VHIHDYFHLYFFINDLLSQEGIKQDSYLPFTLAIPRILRLTRSIEYK
jgi:hypothetical protein